MAKLLTHVVAVDGAVHFPVVNAFVEHHVGLRNARRVLGLCSQSYRVRVLVSLDGLGRKICAPKSVDQTLNQKVHLPLTEILVEGDESTGHQRMKFARAWRR